MIRERCQKAALLAKFLKMRQTRMRRRFGMTGTVNRVLGVMILTVAFAAMGSAENPKKKANSDIENIGNRDINKGSINFISLNKEIEMGRELARQVEEQSK